jgi:hypothetical protein
MSEASSLKVSEPAHEEQFLGYYDTIPKLHQLSTGPERPVSTPKLNVTKHRLEKGEVKSLKQSFQDNPKPSTQTKLKFAEDFGVGLPRINVSYMYSVTVVVVDR